LDSAPSTNFEYNHNTFIRNYWDIIGGVLFALLSFLLAKYHLIALTTATSAISIAMLSITVSEIAEILAERLGEPYGSFILTFTAVAVEIILLFNILLQAGNSPEATDTVKGGIISAVIVDMNVLLGLAVFIGGLSFSEQQHNEDTSSSYTTILYVSAVALLVPSILSNTKHSYEDIQNASMLIGFLLFVFYIIILIFQTKTHTHFFKSTARSRILRYKKRVLEGNEEEEEDSDYIFEKFSNVTNFMIIFVLIAIIGYSAEIFAHSSLDIFSSWGFTAGIIGLIIAIISVTPEIFTAIKAAKNDQIQRVVNIAMGASVVSILITVPVLLVLAYLSGNDLTLDFNSLEVGALLLTIVLAWKTTDDGETNYFEGISHLMLFFCYAVILAFY
jgi:Ca2+:H+ antiporter